ncbi:mitochondrial carrier domain-containing protein [Xylariaceae sp. FL0016]|nr:mitochondrial carrier domain-containing protein [Xylariaceae sp. FL0016]
MSSHEPVHKLLPALHHALSGSLGTLISTCTLYPLSLVITRLQVQRQLAREGKLAPPPATRSPSRSRSRSYSRGRSPSPAPTPAADAPSTPGQLAEASVDPAEQEDPSEVQDQEQEGEEGQQQQEEDRSSPSGPDQHGRPPPPSPPAQEGETLSRAPATPTPPSQHDRAAPPPSQEYAGIVDAFSRIWSSECAGSGGLRAFYSGLGQDAVKSVLDSFLFFLFYEWFRAWRLASRRRRRGVSKSGRGLGVLEELAVGVAAGACSRAFTTPIANVVTRKQTANLVDESPDDKNLSVGEITRRIRAEKGIKGLWSGYSATLLLTLNPGITFFLQEFLKKSLVDDAHYDNPGARMTFLLAASSKAIASCITYPFQIAKTRMQAGTPIKSDEDENLIDIGKSEAGDRSVDKEVEAKLQGLRAVQKLARQSAFGTIAQIVRTEGVGSLYDGVQGELLKGFFSHGTTMLAKDFIHKLLFKLYLFSLGVLAELRARRSRRLQAGKTERSTLQDLPIALQYRMARSELLAKATTSRALEHATVNVVANLIDGTQRGFGKD